LILFKRHAALSSQAGFVVNQGEISDRCRIAPAKQQVSQSQQQQIYQAIQGDYAAPRAAAEVRPLSERLRDLRHTSVKSRVDGRTG